MLTSLNRSRKSAHCLRVAGHTPRTVQTWKDTEFDVRRGTEEILAFCFKEYLTQLHPQPLSFFCSPYNCPGSCLSHYGCASTTASSGCGYSCGTTTSSSGTVTRLPLRAAPHSSRTPCRFRHSVSHNPDRPQVCSHRLPL